MDLGLGVAGSDSRTTTAVITVDALSVGTHSTVKHLLGLRTMASGTSSSFLSMAPVAWHAVQSLL